jgi:hypothetical protein
MRLTWITTTLAAIAGLAVVTGCKDDGEVATTKPTAPVSQQPVGVVPLVARLLITPADVTVPTGPQAAAAVPKTFRLTLVVTNTTSRTYHGESPDAAIARFALTLGDDPLWSYPTAAAQVVTPVTLAPGQALTYNALVTIPDIRPYRGKTLTARAQFTPAALTISSTALVH